MQRSIQFSLLLFLICYQGCTCQNLNEICQQFSSITAAVYGESCYIYDRNKWRNWKDAAVECKGLQKNLPFGYRSRIAWFDSVNTYAETIKLFLVQLMLPYDEAWIGARKRNGLNTRYDMYWYDEQVPGLPVNWLDAAHAVINFYHHTYECFIIAEPGTIYSQTKWYAKPCYELRRFVCEISCAGHCEAIGGVRHKMSCFLLPKRGDTQTANYDNSYSECASHASSGVVGSVGRLAQFDQQAWQFFWPKLQVLNHDGNFRTGLQLQAHETEPIWLQTDGSVRKAVWNPLGSQSSVSYTKIYRIQKSGIWLEDNKITTAYLSHSYICEIVCPIANLEGGEDACPILPRPVNAISLVHLPSKRIGGAKAIATCKAGYRKSSSEDPTCVTDFGELYWDDVLPKCEKISCTFDGHLDSSKVLVTYKGVHPFGVGTVAIYRCKMNLRPPTGQPEILHRTCEVVTTALDAKWSGQQMQCFEPCGALQIEHGNVIYSDDLLYHGTRVLSLTCEAGHDPVQVDAKCDDGQWSIIPVCRGSKSWTCPVSVDVNEIMYTSASCYWITQTSMNWNSAFDACINQKGRFAALPGSDIWNLYLEEFMVRQGATKKTLWTNIGLSGSKIYEYSQPYKRLCESVYTPNTEWSGHECYAVNIMNNYQAKKLNCYGSFHSLCMKRNFFSRFKLIQNQRFDYSSMKTSTELSDRMCGMQCRIVDNCQAFTYDVITGQCLLHWAKPIDHAHLMVPASDTMTGYMIG